VNRIAATVLSLEAIVIGLAIPVAIGVSDIDASTAVPVGLALVVACVTAAALVRRGPIGYYLGSVLQVVAITLGLVVPVMFALGGIFAVLWFLTLRLAARWSGATRPVRRQAQPPTSRLRADRIR
jgi:hypothetical protein